MSIAIEISDESGVTADSAAVWITGHGIPGTGSATDLVALTNQGTFEQVAAQIASATCTGTVATLTLQVDVPKRVKAGDEIIVGGVTPEGYNGLFEVTQVNGRTLQYAVVENLDAGNGGTAYFGSAISDRKSSGLTPIELSTLPKGPGGLPQINLDSAVEGYSAKLIVFVSDTTNPPKPLPFNGSLVTPTDPQTPPFPPQTKPQPVSDIVEFAYMGSRNSTLDVSAVDGLAVPMTLTVCDAETKDETRAAVTAVGVQTNTVCVRSAIGKAYEKFTTAEANGSLFAPLLYAKRFTRESVALKSASWNDNSATLTTKTVHGLHFADWVQISGVSQQGYDGCFQVQTVVSPTSFTVTNTHSSLTHATGGNSTALIFGEPQAVNREFYTIAAPKDWLSNQPPKMAASDPLATYWDETLNKFFARGNYLSVYLGKDPDHPTYSGSSNGTQYSLSNGVHTYSFVKPSAGLASALYVWSQANPPAGDAGLLQDQIWQALCRGVALDGTFDEHAKVSANASTKAWNASSNWYKKGMYCLYAKFLHTGKIDNGAAQETIFLGGAAYAFGEDENPIGDPYRGPLVPSKLDGTVPDGSTVVLRIAPWSSKNTHSESGGKNMNNQPNVSQFKSVSAEELTVKNGTVLDAGLEVKGAAQIRGTITIGSTEISEAQLKKLLALI